MLVVLLTCARRCLAPGPSIFITGFVEAGLRVLGGHETILSDAWLAEYYWSDKHDPSASKSIAVELHGEDNYVSNVIVFDYAKVGVLVDGAATLLSGVHTWNGGGVGISINGTYNIQDRILGCYLDYNYLEIVQPFVENQGKHFLPRICSRILVGVLRPAFKGRANQPIGDLSLSGAAASCRRLYFSADARSSDDVIAFEGT